jgi:hypothetical protein
MHCGETVSPGPAEKGRVASKGWPIEDLTLSSPRERANAPALAAKAANAISHLLMDKVKTISWTSDRLGSCGRFLQKMPGANDFALPAPSARQDFILYPALWEAIH